ncbi:unnamed protein product [Arctia plantaginis]|uniref:Envelope protein n=1 Tax=Arctia plantaginis TaxID=874455 RepID=A0A8S1AIE8_ARCPL|nr:unnamed protein product [Arctia plantaginis]
MAASYFGSTSFTAYLLLTNLKNIQEMLFSALTDVYQGHIDVHLLTPVNVIKQLNMISGRLPKTLSLPIDNLELNIKNLYKLIYAKARITGEYFLLEVHIPLASHEDYSLYHIIPLPLKTTKYMAVNFGKNTYVSITEERLANCNELSSQHWICNLNLPVQHIENTNAPCERKLLSQQTSSPCNTRNIICEERWIELHTQNTWIALCCDSCTLRTICDKDVTTHVISTSSIVVLKQGCLLQTKTFLIHSRNNYNSKVKLELDIQIPLLNTSLNAIISTQKTPPLQLFEDRNIDIVKKKLEHIKNHEQLIMTITATDLHQFTICYLLLASAIIALIVWLVKKKGYCARRVKVSPAKKDAARHLAQRATETLEQTQAREIVDAERHTVQRAAETLGQTQVRLILDAEHHATERAAETLEQTQARQILDAERHATL